MASPAELLKAQLRELDAQRLAIEREIAERTARINAPGKPGMTGSLVDKEGYPRSDIDVHAVRTDRNRIVCLTNDHKQLSARIDGLLQQLHTATRQPQGSAAPPEFAPVTSGSAPSAPPAASSSASTSANGDVLLNGSLQHPQQQQQQQQGQRQGQQQGGSTSGPMDVDPVAEPLVPFALVDEVSEASPASTAGIQVGDQLCRFGSVAANPGSSGGQELLQQVAAQLQASVGAAVEAVVLRHGLPVRLTLIPRPWHGRGLLGCHLQPLAR